MLDLSAAGHGLSGAVANGLTIAAKQTSEHLTAWQRTAFKSAPTSFTQQGISYLPAEKSNRDIVSWVFIKNIQAGYEQWPIDGGERVPSGGRKSIPEPQPGTEALVGGKFSSAVRDLMRSTIQSAILNRDYQSGKGSQVGKTFKKKAGSGYSISANGAVTMKGGNTGNKHSSGAFVGKPTSSAGQGLPNGLWQREGRRLRLLVVFAKDIEYKATVPWTDEALRFLSETGPVTMTTSIGKVIDKS